MSKNWFHVGLRLFLTGLVVYVWSASTETTANGSGRAKSSRFTRELAARTGHDEAILAVRVTGSLTSDSDCL
jgi:hypothetical protein